MAQAERRAGDERSREGEGLEAELLDGVSGSVAASDEDAADAGGEQKGAQLGAEACAERGAVGLLAVIGAEGGVENDALAAAESVFGGVAGLVPIRGGVEVEGGEALAHGLLNLPRGDGRATAAQDKQAIDGRGRGQLRRSAEQTEVAPLLKQAVGEAGAADGEQRLQGGEIHDHAAGFSERGGIDAIEDNDARAASELCMELLLRVAGLEGSEIEAADG